MGLMMNITEYQFFWQIKTYCIKEYIFCSYTYLNTKIWKLNLMTGDILLRLKNRLNKSFFLNLYFQRKILYNIYSN